MIGKCLLLIIPIISVQAIVVPASTLLGHLSPNGILSGVMNTITHLYKSIAGEGENTPVVTESLPRPTLPVYEYYPKPIPAPPTEPHSGQTPSLEPDLSVKDLETLLELFKATNMVDHKIFDLTSMPWPSLVQYRSTPTPPKIDTNIDLPPLKGLHDD